MPRTVTYQGTAYEVSDAHPAADALPWHLDRPAFAEMVADMRAAGYDRAKPVVRQAHTGRVVSGRRRELAAQVAGVEPVYFDVKWDDEEVTEYVRRDELLRRDLDPTERAAAAVELADLLGRGRPSEKTGKFAGLSQAEIAEQAGVSVRTVRDTVKVKTQAPELMPAVKEGKIKAHVAAKVADLPAAQRKQVADSLDPKKAAREAVGKAAKKKAPTPAATSGSGRTRPSGNASDVHEGQAHTTPDPEPDQHPADTFAARLAALCRILDGTKKDVREAAAVEVYGRHLHAESVTAQIEAARKALWQSRPTEPCNCTRGGKEPAPDCKACFGTGRTIQSRVLKGGK